MRKAHCLRGHEWNEANTYLRPDDGARMCRACRRELQRNYLVRRILRESGSREFGVAAYLRDVKGSRIGV